jgi:ABC-2 type transport system ATP-binding protein
MRGQKRVNKAILLSSHILTEIENIADRIVFIHRGRVIKIVTREELAAYEGEKGVLRIILQAASDDAVSYLKTLGGTVQVQGNEVILSDFRGDSSQVNSELVKKGIPVREIKFEKTGLEQFFFDLIGKADSAK